MAGGRPVIVSHSLKTIFIKTYKTAGTSIEFALAGACRDEDVITQVPGEEAMRQAYAGRSKQNDDVTWRTMTPKWAATWLLYRRRPRLVREHSGAARARKVFGQQMWDDYFTWTVERNPWDKAASLYFWKNPEGTMAFSEYLRAAPRDKLSCFNLYSDRGKIVVDRVLRYERLTDDLAEVWQTLGIQPLVLPRMKSDSRPGWTRDYRSLYTDEDAEFVAEVCRREIRAFGYSF